MPLPRDDQEILIHALVGIREAGDKFNLGVPSF